MMQQLARRPAATALLAAGWAAALSRWWALPAGAVRTGREEGPYLSVPFFGEDVEDDEEPTFDARAAEDSGVKPPGGFAEAGEEHGEGEAPAAQDAADADGGDDDFPEFIDALASVEVEDAPESPAPALAERWPRAAPAPSKEIGKGDVDRWLRNRAARGSPGPSGTTRAPRGVPAAAQADSTGEPMVPGEDFFAQLGRTSYEKAMHEPVAQIAFAGAHVVGVDAAGAYEVAHASGPHAVGAHAVGAYPAGAHAAGAGAHAYSIGAYESAGVHAGAHAIGAYCAGAHAGHVLGAQGPRPYGAGDEAPIDDWEAEQLGAPLPDDALPGPGLDSAALEALERRALEAGADDGTGDAVYVGKSLGSEGGGGDEAHEEVFGQFSPRRLSTYTIGEVRTELYRRFFTYSGGLVSPWHDIPLFAGADGADGALTMWMVTEIPKSTRLKQGILVNEMMNPIAQKIENGAAQEYKDQIMWNYGFLPQTWEDPAETHPELDFKGGNCPLDAIEIGAQQHLRGDITRVKVVGAFLVIDRGELDWKIVVVDVRDPLASKLKLVPQLSFWGASTVSELRKWFKQHEAPQGRVGDLADAQRALDVVEKAHEAWRRLRNGEAKTKWAWVGETAGKQAQQTRSSGQVEYTGKPRSRLVPQHHAVDSLSGGKNLDDLERDMRRPPNRGHRPVETDEDLRATRLIASRAAGGNFGN